MSADTGTMIDLTRGIYRRVYAGFINGRRINGVSIGAEAWFWRLLVLADDYGNLYGEPDALCAAARGRRKAIGSAQSERWLVELKEANLVRCYDVDGERYLAIVGFYLTQPAGRNGRRIKRVPGESRGIQGNPGESKTAFPALGDPGESGGIRGSRARSVSAHSDLHSDTDKTPPSPPKGGETVSANGKHANPFKEPRR